MATFKLSLFSLFLIILFTLIVSILVGDWFQKSPKEGMVSFQYGTTPLTNVYIPEYSGVQGNLYGNNVSLVFDTIFFDQDNRNVIEVDSSKYDGNIGGNVDSNGISITDIHISNVNNSTTGFPNVVNRSTTFDKDGTVVPYQTSESKKSFTNSYTEIMYSTVCKYTDKYAVFVLPWKDSTYIHILNKTQKTNVSTTYFGPNNTSSYFIYQNANLPFNPNTLPANYSFQSSTTMNSFIVVPSYDKKNLIYQLSPSVFFDNSKGLIIIYSDKQLQNFTAYKNGVSVATSDISTTTIKNTSFTPSTAFDTLGNNMVLCVQNGLNIIIALIQPDGNTGYKLFNVQRFNEKGLDSGPAAGQPGASNFIMGSKNITDSNNNNNNNFNSDGCLYGQVKVNGMCIPDNNSNPKNSPGPTNMMNDYYQWFYYWATQGLNKNPNSSSFNYSDDYIMKTQIVPPVCPSCPSCPSVGTCTHCGGQGGSGTKAVNGNSLTESSGINMAEPNGTNNYNMTGGGITMSSAANNIGGVLNNAINQPANIISGVGNTVEKGVSGAVDIAKDTVSGTVTGLNTAASSTVDVGREIVGGTVGLGKDIVGGAVGLGKDIVRGVRDMSKEQSYNNRIDRTGYSNSYGGSTIPGGAPNQLMPQNNSSVTDPYSYYGAAPNKGSNNYMPLSSDFSKFGR